jgi:hypothetical protein
MAAIDLMRRIVFLSQGRWATANNNLDSTGFGGNFGGVHTKQSIATAPKIH